MVKNRLTIDAEGKLDSQGRHNKERLKQQLEHIKKEPNADEDLPELPEGPPPDAHPKAQNFPASITTAIVIEREPQIVKPVVQETVKKSSGKFIPPALLRKKVVKPSMEEELKAFQREMSGL